MIELSNVSKSYPGKDRKAVDGLSWTVVDGRITGFFGPNGTGKSTTLKMICGVHSIDEGSIKINGHDIATDAVEAKRQFGYVPDDPDRFLRLTGVEYLNFMADMYGTPSDRRPPSSRSAAAVSRYTMRLARASRTIRTACARRCTSWQRSSTSRASGSSTSP